MAGGFVSEAVASANPGGEGRALARAFVVGLRPRLGGDRVGNASPFSAQVLVRARVEGGNRVTERARSGDVARIAYDPDALEAFYREHLDAVQRFVTRRVHEPYLAADLTADVFLAAIDSAHTYRPSRGEPLGWLYGVARNVVAAEHRRSARERRSASRIPASADLVDPDDLARLNERIDAAADARRLYLAMDRLAAGERAVLELVALEGLTVRDAARVLDIRPVTARVRLHRTRRRLRDQLDRSAAETAQRLSEASP
jgi:RNA polymerase sigma factor (sigma-70 family)